MSLLLMHINLIQDLSVLVWIAHQVLAALHLRPQSTGLRVTRDQENDVDMPGFRIVAQHATGFMAIQHRHYNVRKIRSGYHLNFAIAYASLPLPAVISTHPVAAMMRSMFLTSG